MLVSIIVPTFQRAHLLKRLALTAQELPAEIEILAGADGGGYAPQDFAPLKVINLPKMGRFGVLKALCEKASGRYVMISDDDDFFLPGQLASLLGEVKQFDSARQQDEIGLILKCDYLNKARSIKEHSLAGKMDILAPLFRWDIKNDFKQVVDISIFRRAIGNIRSDLGRVPTSLIWLYCGDHGLVLYRPIAVMVKDYLPSGLSSAVKKNRILGGAPYRQFYVEALRRTRARKFGVRFAAKCLLSFAYSYRKFQR